MLRLFKFFVVFLVASLAAGFVGWAAMIHDEMADAELALATGRLEVAEKAYNSVLGKVEKIQFFFPGTADEIFSRKAAISYWQGDYEANVQSFFSGRELVDGLNLNQALVAANSVVRMGSENGDVTSVLDSLDRGIAVYEGLMNDYGDEEDVAFNYEYLIKRRDRLIDEDQVIPERLGHPLGREGGLPDDFDGELDEVHIFVPMRVDELEMIEEPTIGTDETIRRRG